MNNDLKKEFDDSIKNLESNLGNIRAGRANPNMFNNVVVEYYGSTSPLKSLAVVSLSGPKELVIRPFDKTSLKNIEKAIFEADLGLTPGNDGETIRIVMPDLTSERREELIKQAKEYGEEAKISIRVKRQEALKDIEKEELSEDESKRLEKEIQNLVNEYNSKVESLLDKKEKELKEV